MLYVVLHLTLWRTSVQDSLVENRLVVPVPNPQPFSPDYGDYESGTKESDY